MSETQQPCRVKRALLLTALGGCLGLTGCMGNYSGQNLPSAYYLNAQVQYYPPGNQFKLTDEAAAQKAYREQQAPQQSQSQVPPPPPLPQQ
jgi:hypothetical protein